MLLWYVSRATTRLGAVADEVLNVFPDGALAHKAAEVERDVTEAIITLTVDMDAIETDRLGMATKALLRHSTVCL